MSPSPASALRWQLALLAVSVTGSLLLAEAYLRTFRPVAFREPLSDPSVLEAKNLIHRRSSIPGLRYELTPNLSRKLHDVMIRTNSFGMRDIEPLSDDSGVVRIAVLGDSYTFGYGVEQRDAYSQVLENLLNRHDGDARYDVLNFGVGGYSTRDEALVLRHKVLAWNPALVIVGYVLNDPETRPFQPLHRHFHDAPWWQYSHLLRLLAQSQYEWDVWRLGGGERPEYLHRDEDRWQTVVDGLTDIAEQTQSRGIRALIVIFPLNPMGPAPGSGRSWDAYRFTWIHEKVGETASRLGFDVVDLLPAYSIHPPRQLRKRGAGVHPNELGHQLAAEAVLEHLLDVGFLDEVSPADASHRAP